MTTNERIIPVRVADDGSAHYTSVTSPPDDSTAVCYMIPNRVIPVIFVPGVMGTNLMNRSKKPVWLADGIWSVLKEWGSRGPEKRRVKLDPANTLVYSGGALPAGTQLSDTELRRRGWGEVANMSYGTFLPWLENALNDADTCKNGWRAALMKDLRDPVPGIAPLSYEEVALSYKYHLPVHAVGYNWLESNRISASRLSSKIDEFMQYYRTRRKQCDYVILVTHSMGGLVSRWYSEKMGGSTNILGILHAVMPTTGSATAYTRVKSGTKMPVGIALGANAAEMTAVFAQSPGPLQLLPGTEYGVGWLRIREGSHSVDLPVADPYREVYLSRGHWWSLCDDKLINPIDTNKQTVDQDWASYEQIIKQWVIPFHQGLAGKYHSNSYAFYGDDDAHKTWGEVVWERKIGTVLKWADAYAKVDDLTGGQVMRDTGTGDQDLLQRSGGDPLATHYTLRPAAQSGDGTVPVVSGAAPSGKIKLCVGHKDVDHEGAYKKKPQMLFALWAVTRIVSRAKETKMAYVE